nr:DUF4167 domain-containing protein [Sandarakinorhabdus oryzae]
MIRNNQRRRRGGGNNGPRPQQMAGGNNYGARLDNRQRGNATQLLEKYRALARDAQQAGDRVTAEYYLQYAEHYFRLLGDYRDRQPEGRRGRDGYDDEGMEGDTETAESDAGDERDDSDDDRRDNRRDERGRDDRQRDDRPRDDRQRGDRNRDDRPRDDRPRDERPRDDRPRDDRPRDDRPRNDRPRDDRGGDRNRRDWQRDRRPERSDQGREADGAESPVADERESLLQALPPPVSRGEGRRLGLRREPVEAAAADVPAPADVADDAAPRRRTRAKKPVTEAESAD